MKATLRSARIAPKKANLIARMVRGMAVPDAVEALRRTNKKAARMIEDLLRSAIANASHNDKQDPQTMIVKSIIVNQGQGLRRGMPKARGQTRPFRKFMSHVEIVLGYPSDEGTKQKSEKKQRKQKSTNEKIDADSASQASKKPVKDSRKQKGKSSSASSASSDSSASS
jgi:large subunit ribosomal protein L22